MPRYVTNEPTTFVQDEFGWLVDPFSLEFAVLDVSTPAKRAAPVVVNARAPVNPASYPTGDKIERGYFRAHYTDGAPTAYGRRIVRFYCVLKNGDAETTWDVEWEVLEGGRIDTLGPLYALVSDLRDEGLDATRLANIPAQILLRRASFMVEKWTGRVFAPVPKTVSYDGTTSYMMQLDEAIVAMDELVMDLSPFDPGGFETDHELVRVFNRHLRQRLVTPDDRENPKLELYRPQDAQYPRGFASFSNEALAFYAGQQNVHVRGVFGYTDPDGSPMGRTPEMLRHVTKLLAFRELQAMTDPSRLGTISAYMLTLERTRDQEVQYTQAGRPGNTTLGAFTGDPEIDQILAMYVRPPMVRAV